MNWERRSLPVISIFLMGMIVFLLLGSQIHPVIAQPNSINTSTSTNLLIYKDFGEEAYTVSLPGTCMENCDQDSTSYYKPDINPTPYTCNEIEKVTTTGMWPYTPTVKIISHWPSGDATTCSGMLVQALTLVTAGQCVYTHQAEFCPTGEDSCWVNDLEVIPAYTNGEYPFGESGYKTILTWTAWTETENSEYNLAAVQLRYPIGASLGWLGVGFTTDDAYFLNNEFSITSYPGSTPFNGETMALWTGAIDQTDTNLLYFEGISDSGQIGASLNGANGVVYGTLSIQDSSGDTGVTRITYEKFAAIRDFIELGMPKETLDLAVFDVHANPKWNLPGQTLYHLDFFVQNFSNEDLSEDSYNFSVYLSEDTIITDADILLGVVTYTGSLSANTGLRLSFSSEAGLSLPTEIHGDQPNGGTFYVGVISNMLDSDEYNSCSDYYQPEPIWVNDSDNSNFLFPIIYSD